MDDLHVSVASPAEPPEPEYEYAGFWIRFGAAIVDGLIMLSLAYLIFNPIRRSIGVGETELSWVDGFESLVSIAYYVLLTTAFGQTLGKMLFGIRVVPQDGSGKNKLGWILLRETLGKLCSAIILCIGYIMAGFDKQKRALHDRMASTYVIKDRR